MSKHYSDSPLDSPAKNLGPMQLFPATFEWAQWSKAKKQAIAQHLQTTPDDNLGMPALLAFSQAKRNILKEFAEDKTAMKLTNVSEEIENAGQNKLLLNNNTLIADSDDYSVPYNTMCAYARLNLKYTSVATIGDSINKLMTTRIIFSGNHCISNVMTGSHTPNIILSMDQSERAL